MKKDFMINMSSSVWRQRELHDFILSEIGKRSGKELPIETRMLSSIRRTCELSGMRIEDIGAKYPDWGGGLRNRLGALDQGELYVSLQRIPSHAIHGTWVDLILHHLEAKEGGFLPKATWGNMDDRYFGPIALYTIEGAKDYVKSYFGDQPELNPLYTRMDDLQQRILKVGHAHEDWLEKD